MKIAITSKGNDSSSIVDSRFGRCSYFALYDTETKELDYIPNPNKELEEGAGMAAVNLIHEFGASKIVSGEFGFKIKNRLNEFNIQMIIMKKIVSVQDIVRLIDNSLKDDN